MTTLAIASESLPAPARPELRARAILAGGAVALVASLVLASSIGAVAVTPAEMAAALANRLGFDVPVDPQREAVWIAIRLPRVILAALVGAGLAVSGAAMQALFRNPLGDPGLLGVSNGAALATTAMIVVGGPTIARLPPVLASAALPLAAFLGSLAATALVWVLAARAGQMVMVAMLLVGIAINALAGAATSLFTVVASDPQLRSLAFWQLGSLGGASWRSLLAITPFVLAALFVLPRLARALNLLLLGESDARHLGVPVETVKRVVVVVVALAVGASVSTTGAIGFVGLVAPHLCRLVLGADHRFLLPGAGLLGATLLVLADLVARTVVAPAELPIGILTALLGAPFFLWLLRDRRAVAGGGVP